MLNDIIKISGKTRASWAADLGISPAYLSDLLNGKKIPSLRLAVRIEDVTSGAVRASCWIDRCDKKKEAS